MLLTLLTLLTLGWSYKNWLKELKVQASSLWRSELVLLKLPSQAPGRLPAYVHFNNNNLDRVNQYKPPPYLNVHHGHALEPIRLRAQAWTQYIPTHLHFSARQARNEYQHRYCGYCKQQGLLGDEAHIFPTCPVTASLRDVLLPQITRKLARGRIIRKPSPIPPKKAYKVVDERVCPPAPPAYYRASGPT